MNSWISSTFFLALMSSGASACITRHMTFDEAWESSNLVLLGRIVQVGSEEKDRFGRSRHDQVRVLDVLSGDLERGTTIEVDLYRAYARLNEGGRLDCPLIRGSGREDDFKPGEQYLLLLKREESRFDLYWSRHWQEKPPRLKTGEDTIMVRFPEPTKTIVSTTDATLTYVVENLGSRSVVVNPDRMGSAIFAVEILDDGKRMLTIPPSVPPIGYEPPSMTLAPGQRRMFSDISLNVFSPPLPAGTYVVRISHPGVSELSETLTLIVTSDD